MDSRDQSADGAILTFLAFIFLIIAFFSLGIYWMTRPTVLTNVSWQYVPRPDPFAYISKYSGADQEQLSRETAEIENKEQGFAWPEAVAAGPFEETPRMQAKPKPKPGPAVVRAQKNRERARDPLDYWGAGRPYAEHRNSWFW